ncbi:MAG: hypothetical protein GY697_01140 [Desulfobacterales bacterium]|nr:hypothetical protein [Desulfobacterales bacterium]
MDFKESPQSVKNGLTVLFLAWVWHLVSIHRYFLPNDDHWQQIVIGLLVCIFVFAIKNWGRVLCIVCNILVVALYLLLGAFYYSNGEIRLGLIALFNVALFSLATYFLMLGSSSAYYKSKVPKKEESTENDSEGKKE